MNTEIHRPDILTCLANLSSDEVFTPPKVANDMLDLLPPEVWKNPNLKWLNPASKSGGILREIARRLMEGLNAWEPDERKRRNHILQNMVYGIGITEICAMLTRRSLYCSIHANNKSSNCQMETEEGNIFFSSANHTFKNGKCTFCGAPEKEEYVDDVKQEIHAYQFIHDNLPRALKNMKIDIIVMNPPYQLKDNSGAGSGARPIYQLFVLKTKNIAQHLIAIIPARWYAGGKGLDSFRKDMMTDRSLKTIVDIPNANDVFPGVDIAGGICYFHRDSKHKGECNFNKIKRSLDDYDVIIRDEQTIPILERTRNIATAFFMETVSSRKPFGLPSNHRNFQKTGIPCLTKSGIKYVRKEDIKDTASLLGKWKVAISKAAPQGGRADKEGKRKLICICEHLPPNTACLETYLIAGTYKSEQEAQSAKTYLQLKLPQFLLSLRVPTQNMSKDSFKWVPLVDFTKEWDDQKVYKHFGLTKEEIETVEATIK